jgi:hypothetical protein
MIGGIQPALGRAPVGKCAADQHQSGTGDACFLHLGADVAQDLPRLGEPGGFHQKGAFSPWVISNALGGIDCGEPNAGVS